MRYLREIFFSSFIHQFSEQSVQIESCYQEAYEEISRAVDLVSSGPQYQFISLGSASIIGLALHHRVYISAENRRVCARARARD